MAEIPLVDPAVVDLARLTEWMDTQGLGSGPLEDVTSLAGGTQNVLLRFVRDGRAYVLRRPPPHLRKNSNETMRREARVLAALADTDVPHPRLIAAAPEEDILGASFYLMEPIDGFNPTQGLPSLHAGDPAVRRAMAFALVDGIVALGNVDYLEKGLTGFGKPEGYLERQVPRWQAQLDSYSEFEGYPGPEIPGVDAVARWLDENRPRTFQPGILHGDYHMANVMYSPTGPELAAIVDWELSTVGDPLLDLGWLLATWHDPEYPSMAAVRFEQWDGMPNADALVAHYGERASRSVDEIAWYGVLACYKLGIILEGTHARACAGKAPKATGDLLHASTLGLFERAHRMIARG